jgi:2,3-bisphosphoglycerate-independent phosphoglycerate mutase
MKPKPIVLCVLDGWGYSSNSHNNAIALAHKPTWDKWTKSYPEMLLDASGASVGLPTGQMGNSEVGHMTLGTGRVIFQDLPRISLAFENKTFEANPHFQSLIKGLKTSGKTCHLLGLFSPGGVHSHMDHILNLITLLAAENIQVALHLFLDGRDTPPQSAIAYMETLLAHIKNKKTIHIATLMGRYYAMDRDKRWDRVEKAFDAISLGKGPTFTDPIAAIKESYTHGKDDEFLIPIVSESYKGIQDGDTLLTANFRADRMREICDTLLDKDFSGFSRPNPPHFSKVLSMTEYSSELATKMEVLFPPVRPQNTLGEVLAYAGLTQLRIAETEKYAHVTFFFNGGREDPFPKEDRIMVPSPRVATYDLKPEMSAPELTDKVVEAIHSNRFDVIILNYANTDMVGHTGKLEAAIKAVEAVDICLGHLEKAVFEKGGALLVTADHGNAESMEDTENHQPHTSHTTNPVPFFIVTKIPYEINRTEGTLIDIAPTILGLLDLAVPKEMEGHSFLLPPLLPK